jgi:hypothetical protein
MSYNISPNISLLHYPNAGADEDIREREVPTSVSRRASQRRSELFLRGPIPIRLIGAALDLPGRPLPVLLAILHRVAVTGRPWVTLPASVMADFRVGRTAKARALAELERAGLIRVKRNPGRPASVSLTRKRPGGDGAAFS